MKAELRYLHSPDLEEPSLPPDPRNCSVAIQALIGPDDGPGEESFQFEVITRHHLNQSSGTRWGRGLLILDSFDWNVVRDLLRARLAIATGETWHDVAVQLNKELLWEFDDYRPYTPQNHEL